MDLYASGLMAGEKFFQCWNRKPSTLKVSISSREQQKPPLQQGFPV
jgi:hypothetical protein